MDFLEDLEVSKKAVFSVVGGLVIAIVTVFGVLAFTEHITEGEVGVKYSPSGKSEVLDLGWHVIGIGDKVITYPTHTQVVETEVIVGTADKKRITLPVRYEYKIDEANVLNIFKNLGAKQIQTVQDSFLNSRTSKIVKEVTPNYTVVEIISDKSTEASNLASEKLSENLHESGFIIEDVILGVPEVDKQTQASIDAQIQATQANELKIIELENEKLEAEKKAVIANGEAEKARIEAQARADGMIIEATALNESNNLTSQSITPQLLQKQLIDKWSGNLPTVSGEGVTPIIQMPSTEKAE